MQRKGQSSNGGSIPTIPLQVSTTSLRSVPRRRRGGLGGESDGKEPVTNDDLLPGEMICDKCNGTRWLDGTGKKSDWQYTCDKCWGAGKVDWISHIMGAPNPFPRTLKGDWTLEMEKDLVAMHDVNLRDDIMKSLGEELANKIDQEIMGELSRLYGNK